MTFLYFYLNFIMTLSAQRFAVNGSKHKVLREMKPMYKE